MKWFTREGGKVDPGRIPGVKPAYAGIFEDDQGHLWITPYVAEDARRGFDVFDADGRYLGRVDVPGADRSLQLHVVRGAPAYGVARDGAGVEYAVRYRIEGRR